MQRVALLAILLAAAPAAADRVVELVPTCVHLDAEKDGLLPDEQARATLTLTRVLEREELLVVDTGCVDTYTVAHERGADGIVVHVRGPAGARRIRVPSLDRLGDAYRKAVRDLRAAPALEGPPGTTPAVAPREVMAPAPLPAPLPPPAISAGPAVPATARGLLYWRSFAGVIAGGQGFTGMGLGYRRERNGLAYDASLVTLGNDDAGEHGFRVTGKLLRVSSPEDSSSLYTGVGLALASIAIMDSRGGGVEGVATAGIDLWRDSQTLHAFVEAEIGLPLYSIPNAYPATMSLSFGLGF